MGLEREGFHVQKGAAVGLAVVALVGVGAAPAWSDSASERGQTIYKQCAACHSLEEDVTLVGPTLHDLFGRKAASVDSFTYSDAFYGADFVWDDDHLAQWVHDPRAMIPGTKMQTPGIKDPMQIADLIAYLKEASR
jgi:cytochrome c